MPPLGRRWRWCICGNLTSEVNIIRVIVVSTLTLGAAAQTKCDASDFEATVEELREYRDSAAPEAEEKQRELRGLEREATSRRAALDALRARHEQARPEP